MRIELVTGWKRVLRKAWSVRLMVLAGVLSGLEAVLPIFADTLPRGPFAILSLLAVAGAMVARFVAQPRMHDDS